MKILIFSDIHGIEKNLNYLKKLDDQNKFDKIVCLGDLYYPGPTYNQIGKSNRVLDFLNNYKDRLICLKGNCDSDVDIKVSDFPVVDLALINVDGLNLYFTHGNKYSEKKNNKFKNSILIYGHEHIPYIHQINDMTYICVGSISLPREGSDPSYAIYENKQISIYDIYDDIIDYIDLRK